MVSGERVEVGAVVDLPLHAANLVIAGNKAQLFAAPPPAPEPEPEPEVKPVTAKLKPTPDPD